MPLEIGSRLGPYEIVALIGVGGMGEVYRAHDTKLGRDVAIKILPDAFAADPERIARFQREAKTLASLNHPNIGAIYGLEEAGPSTTSTFREPQGRPEPGRGTTSSGQATVRALVLELVEGPTLADMLAGSGLSALGSSKSVPFSPGQSPKPKAQGLHLDEALPIAMQIADALEAAHEHGIIHRDLKPANIKVTPDGRVKVLDFGLAKALESNVADPHVSASPTISLSAAASRVGMILGTAAYMAPEQAKGKPVDKRADIWAFGAVLYEMLAGKKAFTGDDVSDTLVSVLRDDPDWSALPPDTPASTRQTLRVCLQKDAKRRVRDISAVKLALEGAFETPAISRDVVAPATASPRAGWRKTFPWVLGALVVGGLGVGIVVQRLQLVSAHRLSRFVLTVPPDAPFGVINQPGVAISRDGSRLVYRSAPLGGGGATGGRLYLRAVDRIDATPIQGADAALGPFFSPDGEWIAYNDGRDNTLKRVSVLGGPPLTVCPLDGLLRGASWGADDTIVFATTNSKGLFRVPAVGGKPERVTTADPAKGVQDHFWPETLPDGRSALFMAWNGAGSLGRSSIMAVSLETGAITDILPGGSNPRFSPTGHLVFAAAETLRAVGFDARQLKVVGNPVPVVERVGIEPTGAAHFAIAEDGTLVYGVGTGGPIVNPRTLVWVDRKGREEAINVPPRAYTYARLSPDGKLIAFDSRDEQNDIWIWDLARQTLQRLTNDPGFNRMPVWTPDGKRVTFTAQRDGVESIYWQSFDGSGTPERLSSGSGLQGPQAFSPDGKHLVFSTPFDAPYDLGVISLEGSREPEMLLRSAASEVNAEVSPDGRWLAYGSDESGRQEIYLRPFPKVDASRRQVSTGGGTRPLWSRDGRELFYHVAPDTIMAVPVRPGDDLTLGNPQPVVKGSYAVAVNAGRHYDVSPDGQRFLLLKDVAQAGTAKPVAPEIHIVLNWTEELKRLVPLK